MKHLLKIVTNKKNLERVSLKINNKKGGTKTEKRIAYKINGYWFFFTRKNWCEYAGIKIGTICNRISSGKTNGQILGYEEISNKAGRPLGSKNKISYTEKL